MKKSTFETVKTLYLNRIEFIIRNIHDNPDRFEAYEPKLFEFTNKLVELEKLEKLESKPKSTASKK